MKKFFAAWTVVLTVVLMLATGAAFANPIAADGTFKGIRLWGKVKIVNAFPDIKVQVVDAFPDLKVQRVDAFPDSLGKWQFVTSGEDFKIQFVNAFPDIKIKFVTAFPGF